MTGHTYFFKGLKLLAQPGIRPFVILPVLVNILLFVLLTWLLVDQLGAISSWMEGKLTGWLEWLLWLFWLVIAALWLIIYGYSFSMISNTVAAPFYGMLAEKVQARLTGESLDMPMTFAAITALTRRTMVREVQKLLYVLPRLLALGILSLPLYFVPVIGLAVPVLWFLWGSWSLALQNIDYAADNNQTAFPAMRKRMAQKRLLSLSFGGAAVVASAIPLFNLIAVPAAVAGGTALWLERLREQAGT